MTDTQFHRRYLSIAFWTLSGLALVATGFLLAPFFGALMWAAVLSVLLAPVYRRLRKRFGENFSSGLTVLVALFVVVIPLGLIGGLLGLQVSGFVNEMNASAPAGSNGNFVDEVVKSVDDRLAPVLEKANSDFKFSEWFETNKKEIIERATGPITQAAISTVVTLLTLVIALLTMFFMLRDGHRLLEPALDLIPLPRDSSMAILIKMAETIRAVFIGVVLVAIIQGSIAGILYFAVGAPQPFLCMIATMVLCAIPLLGSPIIYGPVSLILLAQGKTTQGLILLFGGLIIVSNIDNILRPFFIGARTNLHPMAVFFALLGGVLAMGPIGIMAGPVLLTILLALQEIVRERRNLALSEDSPEPAPA
ncbi:MAG TPA: AI-2E family transporter [Fimbriimonadaceae bacterium]|nr:AI-2E family transporter [Fimbriimonadaceae bacterium]HRJ33290.1 AI-2E family transporter [Fimbriimonadaceae bacterium]